jgi:putative ABC transport system permease protein
MLALSAKNLLAHKRRLFSTVTAVVLGVGFLCGVLLLSATINSSFESLFANANRGTDAMVRAKASIDVSGMTARSRIDPGLVDQVSAVDGVDHAELYVQDVGQIVTTGGKAVGIPDRGPPTFAGNWIEDDRLNPYTLVDGRPPRTDDEVVINRWAATDGNIAIGDRVNVNARVPVSATVTGIATYGTADPENGSTFVAFTTPAALRILGEGKADGVKVVATPGVSQDELATRIDARLPDDLEAITGDALTRETVDAVQRRFVAFLTLFLTMFAAIALLVSVFSINNTFSILVSQRTRELALLRAVGASRAQVRTAVLFEAFVIGIIGSGLGLLAGIGLAQGLKRLLAAFGASPPSNGLPFTLAAVALPVVVGVLVTVLAGVLPALKATRVPPVASMRETSVERTSASMARTVVGALLVVVGVGLSVVALAAGGPSASTRVGFGAFVVLVATIMLGPVAAVPISRTVGAALPSLRGVAGLLARENAARNPRRTAGTASALMIGVCVVSLFTVFAASITRTVTDEIDGSFAGDLVVTSTAFGPGRISPELASRVGGLPEVDTAVGIARGVMELDGDAVRPVVADPQRLASVVDIGVSTGSVTGISAEQFAVSRDIAEAKGWAVGSPVATRFADGTTSTFTVGAIYDKTGVVGDYLLSRAAWQPHAISNLDSSVAVKLKDGVGVDQGRIAVERVARDVAAGAKVQDRAAFRDGQSAAINQILGLVYALLALAVLISLLGIGNTLSLSIHERTRELGLLRAVGMARRQLRTSIRWESVIIALFGTVGGLILGLFFSWALVETAGVTYALPLGGLATLVVLGAFAGVVAAARPARRAARLDILRAIAAE